MKRGQGFVRQVTLENLRLFSPFLFSSDEGEKRYPPQAQSEPSDAALKEAEAKFAGLSIKVKRTFKSQKATAVRTTEPKSDIFPVREDPKGDVLIAEIPKASGRWKQANFNKQDFTGFFQAHNPKRRLTLWHVGENGSVVATPEVRHGVSVKSKNFRIELAAAGMSYPEDGRPIGVFLRTAPTEFRYMLLMPGNQHYDRGAEILAKVSKSRADRAKRLRMGSREARAAWPQLPLWSASLRS